MAWEDFECTVENVQAYHPGITYKIAAEKLLAFRHPQKHRQPSLNVNLVQRNGWQDHHEKRNC